MTPEAVKTCMEMMDNVFKYEIGDIVRAVGTPEEQDDLPFSSDAQARFVVLEQKMQRCIGGVQLHYLIRAVQTNGHIGRAVEVNEIMLLPSEPFEDSSTLRAKREERLATLKAAKEEKKKEKKD